MYRWFVCVSALLFLICLFFTAILGIQTLLGLIKSKYTGTVQGYVDKMALMVTNCQLFNKSVWTFILLR